MALAACKTGGTTPAGQAVNLGPIAAPPGHSPELASSPTPEPPSPAQGHTFAWGPAASPDEALKLEERAFACLADHACDDAELERRLRDAAGRGADVCYYWLEGLSVPRDEALARACYGRHVAAQSPPDGGSCGNARMQLALLVGLGRGGRAEPSKARALLEGCFTDMTYGWVMATVEAGSAPDGVVDLCEVGSLTTLAYGGCSAPERLREGAAERALLRAAAARPGQGALSAARRANLAFRDYVEAEASLAYDAYRDGSMRTTAYVSTERAMGAQRRERLGRLGLYEPSASATSAAADAAELARNEALSLRDADAKHRALAQKARAAFARYRAAELALYHGLFAAHFGREALRLDVGAALDRERAGSLGSPPR